MHPPARRINPDSLLVALAARPRIVGIDAVNPLPATSLAWRLSIASDLPSLALITGINHLSTNLKRSRLIVCNLPCFRNILAASFVRTIPAVRGRESVGIHGVEEVGSENWKLETKSGETRGFGC